MSFNYLRNRRSSINDRLDKKELEDLGFERKQFKIQGFYYDIVSKIFNEAEEERLFYTKNLESDDFNYNIEIYFFDEMVEHHEQKIIFSLETLNNVEFEKPNLKIQLEDYNSGKCESIEINALHETKETFKANLDHLFKSLDERIF